jgi:predicted esterase
VIGTSLPRSPLPLAILLAVLGIASLGSTSGAVPALAGAPAAASDETLQAAAPVAQAAALDTPVEVPAAEAVAPATTVPSAAGVPEPAPSPTPEPALQRTGTNTDGWAVYRLGDGRVPDRLGVGEGFRGEITWRQGGLTRKARIYVPRSTPQTAPLLVSLHGLGGSLRQVEVQQRWSTIAFQQEFVLVWGAGHEGSWNAGPCCGSAAGRIDDLAYLDRLLQIAGALHAIDRRRVHLAGYSNGAMLAYRYACGRPGRIAGVLAVAGTHTAPCTPTRATAVLAVHGAQDPTVPLEGTRYSSSLRSRLPAVNTGPRLWARTGAGVRTVVLPGFGHGWPTRHHGGYDATGEGWRFLNAHPKPAG